MLILIKKYKAVISFFCLSLLSSVPAMASDEHGFDMLCRIFSEIRAVNSTPKESSDVLNKVLSDQLKGTDAYKAMSASMLLPNTERYGVIVEAAEAVYKRPWQCIDMQWAFIYLAPGPGK